MTTSAPSASWKRAGWHNSTVPSLSLTNAKAAIEHWQKAFDATIVNQSITDKGMLLHAEVRLGDTMVMVSETNPQMGCEPSSLTLYMYVPDADVAYKRAVAAGAVELAPVREWFWGDRNGTVKDAWGIRWTISTRVKDVTPEEIEAATAQYRHDDCQASKSTANTV